MHGPNFVIVAIACFLCITSFLIVFHELGHYLTARMFGLKPKVFSVGMGPEIAGFTDRHGTRWKIAPIPLGGYVKFHGEMHPGTGTDDEASHPQSFARLARWKRAAIIFAGPFVNILITAVILGTLFTTYGIPHVGSTIQKVTPGSISDKAGIRAGDRILEWNGNEPDGSQRLIRYIKINPGHEIDLKLQRGDSEIERTMTIAREEVQDRFGNQAEIGRVGLLFDRKMKKINGSGELFTEAATETSDLFTIQISTIWQMIKGERSIDEISGPVRLAKFSGEQFITGWIPVIYFTAMLSMAIAFMNLLPVPGLDGGYLALYGVEATMRRDLSRKAFTNAVKVGYGIVGVLTIFGLTNDLRMLMF